MKKRAFGSVVFDIFNILFMLFVIVITIYPFIYVASVSISNQYAVMTNKVRFLPVGFDLSAYKQIFKEKRIWQSYLNTIKYTSIGTVFNVVVTSLMAYGLSKKNLTWRRPILLIVAFTMIFSGGMLPTYFVVRNLKLLDSLWAMVLPTLVSTWNLMVMRTFFEGIPESMAESARIDGASELQTFIRIIVPLSKPIFLVIGLFYAEDHWNSYFNALIYLSDPRKFPLQIVLRNMVIGSELQLHGDITSGLGNIATESIKSAVIMVAIIPIITIYPFIQKYFVKGVMIGAIKG